MAEAVRLFGSGELSPAELVRAQRGVILRLKRLNAFITVFPLPHRHPKRDLPLGGVTLAVKDNICVGGHRTTAGSKVFSGFVPSRDARIVTRLKAAGMTLVGKTNLHEFAFGVTNINPHFGDCRNPWMSDRVSGGSSGGSAVAVATGMACAALGTDTGGSIRTPAALCGVVGFKPSYGLTSKEGVVPLSWSLDTVGFITNSVADAFVLARHTFEGLQAVPPPRHLRPIELDGARLGVPWNILEPLDKGVRKQFERSLEFARGRGARIVPIKFEHFEDASASRSLITYAEAAYFHRPFFSARAGDYGKDVRRRIARGMKIPAVAYVDARATKLALTRYYGSLFGRVDFLLLPATRIPAPTVLASKSEETAPAIRTALLALTEPFNLFGAPAITIPCGLTPDGLPVGLQIAANITDDWNLLSCALALEESLPEAARAVNLRPTAHDS